MMNKLFLVLAVLTPALTSAFSVIQPNRVMGSRAFVSSSSTRLNALLKGKDYDKVVEGIMVAKGMTREEAVKDYDAYLENPNNYALSKVIICYLSIDIYLLQFFSCTKKYITHVIFPCLSIILALPCFHT